MCREHMFSDFSLKKELSTKCIVSDVHVSFLVGLKHFDFVPNSYALINYIYTNVTLEKVKVQI